MSERIVVFQSGKKIEDGTHHKRKVKLKAAGMQYQSLIDSSFTPAAPNQKALPQKAKKPGIIARVFRRK